MKTTGAAKRARGNVKHWFGLFHCFGPYEQLGPLKYQQARNQWRAVDVRPAAIHSCDYCGAIEANQLVVAGDYRMCRECLWMGRVGGRL